MIFNKFSAFQVLLLFFLIGCGPDKKDNIKSTNNALDAFSKIDSETLGNLLKPENVKALSNILTYHVVSGKLMASDVAAALKSGYGRAKLTALNGQTLTARKKDGKIYLKDSQGNMSEIIATDVAGSNGVIHVISSVVMPE